MDFYHLLKNVDKNTTKVATSMSCKYSQKVPDSARKFTKDAIKIASKREIQKKSEATGDLIGNKIADKIISVSTALHPKSPNELHLKELHLQNNDANNEIEVPKERYISPEKRQQIIWWIKISITI